MHGFLDSVSSRSATGWAIEDDGQPANLNAGVNGETVARIRCSVLRPDLAAFSRQDLGFRIDFGRTLRNGDVVTVTNDNDQHLSGSPHEFTPSDLSKEDKALWLISKDMKVLEIGPSFSPIAPKSEGWRSFSLDHASQDELKAKYQHQQPVDRIEPVDYLWRGGPIESAIPTSEYGTFDAVIASHVLEHIPNPIGFFESAALLLNPQGLVSLVMPDKRWMFDFFRPVTVTSDWLLAHDHRRTRHTKKTAFDYISYNVSEKHQIAWSAREMSEFNFTANDVLADAMRKFTQMPDDESGPYEDFHTTICTPSSLALIFLELNYLGLLPFQPACSFPVSGCEFYITLRETDRPKPDPQTIRSQRLHLMKSVVRELGEQAKWLLDE